MELDNLLGVLKRKGLWDTLRVLAPYKTSKVDIHVFYNELKKFSYYNSFFRIKQDLVRRGLVKIELNNKKKYVRLTDRGLELFNKLVDITRMIDTMEK